MNKTNKELIKNKLGLMNWDLLEDADLVNNQAVAAVWKDKIIEILDDNIVNLIDLFGKKTQERDRYGDLIFEEKIQSFKFKDWEDFRDRMVRADFITAPVKDFIKAKRERQVFYLFFIEGMNRRNISNLLGIDNINLNSIIYRLKKRLDGLRIVNEIINKTPRDKIPPPGKQKIPA
ncbi:MAG: hypothetical protein ACE5J5_04805 [Candidatus Hydrothermarchaeales archaeon]